MKNDHLLLLFLLTAFFSCKKVTEEFQTDRVADYMPLKTGQYITYRLDSTVFTRFGADIEVHSYEEKNVVDAEFQDASGRKSFRILRYLRDTLGSQAWKPAGTYFITPLPNQIELVENNLRVIKLHGPIVKDFSWPGNTYLPDDPYESLYKFSNDDYMKSWEFRYDDVNTVFPYKQQNLANVISVFQVDERNSLDTVVVSGNQASIPQDSEAAWIEGSASDTVRITANVPSYGHEEMTLYNRTNAWATFNNIAIPSGYSLQFEYANNKWSYPNPLVVSNNSVTVPANYSLAYILGTATDSIKVNVNNIDTSMVKTVRVYNRSNFDAYCNFNDNLRTYKIPPGYGRVYELYNGEWRLLNNLNSLFDHDPWSSDLPFGSTNFGTEKYAKGIGMVYQEFLMWEYQPNTGGLGGYKTGFGVKRTMIDHN